MSLLLLWNIFFLLTFLKNPGTAERDTTKHRSDYLKKVKILKPHLGCQKCMIIFREDVETTHCDICDYCIEDFDHHC